MFGPCGRFSGVSWANRWVSFMPCLISAYFAIPIEGAGGVKTKRPQRCDVRKLNGGATLVHRRQHLADLAQWPGLATTFTFTARAALEGRAD
jgi:hypothetical protein